MHAMTMTSPTTPLPTIDPSLVRGRLLSDAASESQHIVLGLPGTEYRLHLVVSSPVTPDAVGWVRGRIYARAMRVDVVGKGGRFAEPVYGRPRRLQGVVVATDVSANTITVQGPCPFVCTLTADQRPDDFAPGQFVGFDVQRGARFEPVSAQQA
jgi:hypothetical protein